MIKKSQQITNSKNFQSSINSLKMFEFWCDMYHPYVIL